MDTTYFITQAPSKTWIDWLVAFAPVIVSSVAIVISIWVATRQNDLQARQLRKDLFDRRFTLYTDTREFLNFVGQTDGENIIHTPEYQHFLEVIEKAEMMFGPGVLAYLNEINKTVSDFYVYKAQEQRLIEAGDQNRIDAGTELRRLIYDVFPKRRNDVFRDYLTLGTSK
jgi:hypothetical protein